jgi:hypothetical protein
MGRRTFTVADITEILLHWHAGRSQREIASSLGLDRKTVRKYLRPARAEGLYPGRVSLRPDDWAALVRIWFPDVADARLRQVTWAEIARYRTDIEAMLGQAAVATIWRRLREEHHLACSLASFRRYLGPVLAEARDGGRKDHPSGCSSRWRWSRACRDGELSEFQNDR